jgi:3-phenylpropionate/trans-cinnamate dioxygenase ferredoxin subunit
MSMDSVTTVVPDARTGLESESVTLDLADIPERTVHEVTVGRRTVLLFRFGSSVYATAHRCTHQGAELTTGVLDGALLRCPWHGVKFDVRTGARVTAPKCRDLRTFPVEVADGRVTLRDDQGGVP